MAFNPPSPFGELCELEAQNHLAEDGSIFLVSLKARMALPASREREGPVKPCPDSEGPSQADSGMTFFQGLVPGAPEAIAGLLTGSPMASSPFLLLPFFLLFLLLLSPSFPFFFLPPVTPSPIFCLPSSFSPFPHLSFPSPPPHLSLVCVRVCMWRSENSWKAISLPHSTFCWSQGLSLTQNFWWFWLADQ